MKNYRKESQTNNNMEKLHFTVSGEWLTQFAREQYKETKDLKAGVYCLTTALIGFPEYLARDIVKGKLQLKGKNEVTVEEDCTEVIPYGVILPVDIKNVLCGWIAPDGRVFGVNVYTQTIEHDDLAREICAAQYVDDTEVSSYRSVEKAGWIKFSTHLCASAGKAANITLVQKLLIQEYIRSHQISLYQIGFGCSDRLFNLSQILTMETLQFGLYVTGRR